MDKIKSQEPLCVERLPNPNHITKNQVSNSKNQEANAEFIQPILR